jgi:small subunit ribosomal protein S1
MNIKVGKIMSESKENKQEEPQVTSEAQASENQVSKQAEAAAEEVSAAMPQDTATAEAADAAMTEAKEVVETSTAEADEAAVASEGAAPADGPAEKSAETEEFNWDDFESKSFGEEYSSEEREKLEAMIEGTLTTVTEKEVVEGVVVGITDRDVIVNIGFKSDGLVPLNEFRDTAELKIGDTVEVYLEEQENAQGQLILSRRKAKIVQAWKNIQESFEFDY